MSNDKDNADLTAALKDKDRAGLVNALKNLAGQRSDVLENLPPKVRKRVDALRDVHGQHDELEAKFREERALLEAKYQKLYQPLYTKLCLHLIPAMVAAISVTGPENVPSHLKPQFIELKGQFARCLCLLVIYLHFEMVNSFNKYSFLMCHLLLEEGEVGKDQVTFRSKLELPVQMVFEKWRLRFVFRQLTRCKYEPLLNILLTMPEGPAGEDMKDLMLEMCLMFPARLSSLLPYLPCLMKALVFCLKGSDEFVSLGLRRLEFWVDNLNHDFLEPNVVNVMSEVTLLLWSHLRLVPHPCYKKALKWKLGGRKNPPFQKEPLTLECKYVKSQSATCCLYLCFKSFGSKTLLSDTYDEFVENSCRNFAVILHVDYSSSNASTSTSSLGGSVILASSKSKSIQSSNSKQSNPLILLDVLVDVLANENWVHAKAVLNVLNVLAETFLFLARVKHADVLMGRGGHNASIIVSSPSTNSVYSPNPSVVSRTGSEETELLEPSYQLLLQPLILRPLRCKTVEQQRKAMDGKIELKRNIKHLRPN